MRRGKRERGSCTLEIDLAGLAWFWITAVLPGDGHDFLSQQGL